MTRLDRRSVARLLAALPFLAACARAGELKQAEGMPWHHTEDGFRNPPGSPTPGGTRSEWWGFMLRGLSRRDAVSLPAGHVLPHADALAGLAAPGDADRVTWLGHAAFLLRLDGRHVLVDPYLSPYASPLPPFGPKRFAPAILQPDDLPSIDVLLLSHNHYDHLDLRTLGRLKLQPDATLVCPLKVSGYVDTGPFAEVVELDWHDATRVAGLGIQLVPSIHFSARTLFDRNKSLWGGFVVTGSKHRVYHAGDTSFGPVFDELGPVHAGVDLAILPIGAYEPRELMKGSHCTPEQAARIATLFRAKRVAAGHWGTIRLTDEPPFEPPGRFRDAMRAEGHAEDAAWIMAIGETRPLG